MTANLTTEQGLAAAIKHIEDLREIELLVNNAGLANAGNFLEASLEHELGALKLNTWPCRIDACDVA